MWATLLRNTPETLFMLTFEWDDTKAQANIAKHGVSFEEGASVLGDPLAITFPDPDHSTDEERWLTFGLSQANRLLLIAHLDNGESIRIISCRKATRHERQIYEQG